MKRPPVFSLQGPDRRMSLNSRITIGGAVAIFVAIAIFLYSTMRYSEHDKRRAMEEGLLCLASMVAQYPEVMNGLTDSPDTEQVQRRIQSILASNPNVDQITVCNMMRIRYSHTNPEFIGKPQEGDDIKEVIYQAKRYVSSNISLPGIDTSRMLRAYAPVFNGETQIGFVITEIDIDRFARIIRHFDMTMLVYAVAGLSAGVTVIFLVGQIVRNALLGLEPDRLAQVYREHAGLIEAMHEGVIGVNRRGRITLINKRARELLEVENSVTEGMEIDKVMPNPHLARVISTGEAEFDYEKRMKNRTFIASMVPVRENERVVGAVETFQDRTQLLRMAEELTGIKQLVEALRASSHEFSNKLHAILGLLELGEYDHAKEYIQQTQQSHGQLQRRMLHAFKDPMIAGLMLGKYNVAKEQGVELVITPGSSLGPLHSETISHSLVLIIGNLVDNAFDAVREGKPENGCITLDIKQDNRIITMRVRDNGVGIPPENAEAIFSRGFSTKGEGRGTGLHLVRQEVTMLGGDIAVRNGKGETVFMVSIPDKESGG